jgi:hypothetical protein
MIDRAGDAERYEVVCGGFDPYLGGRLVFVTVGPPEANDLPRVIAAAMPAPATAPIRSLADPAYVEEALTGAGYRNVAVEPAETRIEPGPDATATAEFILAWGAFGGAVDDATAREALTEAARPYETSSGVRLRGTAWLVSAIVAGSS